MKSNFLATDGAQINTDKMRSNWRFRPFSFFSFIFNYLCPICAPSVAKLFFVMGATLALCACGGRGGQAVTPQATKAPTVGTATIRGTVFYPGTPPPRAIVCAAGRCHEGAPAIYDETVIVNPNHTLQNVIVYLQNAPQGNGGGPAVKLDQINCHFVPHVLALQVFEPLIIQNSDSHLHNVDMHCQVNQLAGGNNFNMFGNEVHSPVTFQAPEFFPITCDVHPWMRCEVGVFDNPYFAVTGTDGTFVLHNVPAGTYVLAARHERYGELTQSVTVADNQTVDADFTFKQP